MSEYHLVGDPIDNDNRPAVFELVIQGHLPCVDPKNFDVPNDIKSVDPYYYFITSGDALSKAIKLEKDMWSLASELRKKYTKSKKVKGKMTWITNPEHKKYADYIEAVWKCAGRCRAMANRLCEAKGPNCFLETEWREQHLIVIPKNPRVKPKVPPTHK